MAALVQPVPLKADRVLVQRLLDSVRGVREIHPLDKHIYRRLLGLYAPPSPDAHAMLPGGLLGLSQLDPLQQPQTVPINLLHLVSPRPLRCSAAEVLIGQSTTIEQPTTPLGTRHPTRIHTRNIHLPDSRQIGSLPPITLRASYGQNSPTLDHLICHAVSHLLSHLPHTPSNK